MSTPLVCVFRGVVYRFRYSEATNVFNRHMQNYTTLTKNLKYYSDILASVEQDSDRGISFIPNYKYKTLTKQAKITLLQTKIADTTELVMEQYLQLLFLFSISKGSIHTFDQSIKITGLEYVLGEWLQATGNTIITNKCGPSTLFNGDFVTTKWSDETLYLHNFAPEHRPLLPKESLDTCLVFDFDKHRPNEHSNIFSSAINKWS